MTEGDQIAPPEATHRSAAARRARTSAVSGSVGAVSAAHPAAASAAVEILRAGGNAFDAAVAAQAVVSVVLPQAAGLGGDLLALVRRGDEVIAINGNGRSPSMMPRVSLDSGASVTVPGLIPAWIDGHAIFGALPLEQILRPAIRMAEHGVHVDPLLRAAVDAQAGRIRRSGGAGWSLLDAEVGSTWCQPELAHFLDQIGRQGLPGFYADTAVPAIARAVQSNGGTLSAQDISAHRTWIGPALCVPWNEETLWVQPPSTQGVLLAMACNWLNDNSAVHAGNRQHAMVELTNAVFAYRDRAKDGQALLQVPLEVDVERARNRGGPRSYLHTAAVAAADADGMVVSSLISIFDDFGSGVVVPELGIVLNNRAAGFTSGANHFSADSFPVHTLAPAMVTGDQGRALALATPGADGQVQTLLQVLSHLRWSTGDIASALDAPRWRSQEGDLLVETDLAGIDALMDRGHRVVRRTPGEDIFGGVAVAGWSDGRPFAASDWRRQVTSGAA